jgi:hypothetical protein
MINGVASHLATLTSSAEQTFVGGLVNGGDWAWIDGSDSAVEGTFRWESGPESGTAFNNGVLNWFGGGGPNPNSAAADNVLIWDGGGDVLYVYTAGNTAFGYVAEWEGSSLLVPTVSLVNTTAETVSLSGGDGQDTLYGGTGIDTFIFEAANAYNDQDQIIDFVTGAGGDAIDISDLLTGFSGPITDWLNFEVSGSDTLIQVDANGTTGGENFITIGEFTDLTGLDEAALYASGNVVV